MHPTLLHLGPFVLPTFGLLAAIGLMAALTLSLRTAPLAGLSPDRIWNAGLFTLLSAFVLSRLLLVLTNLHTFLSYPILLLAVPSLTPLGILLTGFAAAIYLRLNGLPLLATLDAWAPCATLVWVFLALGHFAEGSDPGMITSVPWAIPSSTGLTRLHPIALYAAVLAAILTYVLFRQLPRRRNPGDTAALALASTGIVQFLLSFLRQPALFGTPLGDILDPIQWAALGMVLAAGLILITQPRRPVSHAV
ncbi:prolipoprotein diacylglyceryl transferase [Edaphobacter bradus]|uniref:prolipoprotein diacylglyceryl transferase n=1 Tax=Edaphobacter bradus TaxID=2259016 RepID=UPI0021E006AB|nr:prolipoprotein diacylglyceryl transferase family protein [Edaphobacter bradus]